MQVTARAAPPNPTSTEAQNQAAERNAANSEAKGTNKDVDALRQGARLKAALKNAQNARSETDAKLIESTVQNRPGKPATALRGAKDSVSFSNELNLRLSQDILNSEIGRRIDKLFEEHGVDLDEHVDEDMSVKATSDRIADFALGQFDVYKKQHADLDEETVKKKFETEIRAAVNSGYDEAVKILKGMQVTQDVLDISKQTIDAVHKRFDDFFGEKSESEEQAAAGQELVEKSPKIAA
jgi:hypothetical protein